MLLALPTRACQKYAVFGIILPMTIYEQIYDESKNHEEMAKRYRAYIQAFRAMGLDDSACAAFRGFIVRAEGVKGAARADV